MKTIKRVIRFIGEDSFPNGFMLASIMWAVALYLILSLPKLS